MPVDRDKILQEAQKLAERKQFGKAVASLQKLVAEDPKDVRTLLKIGDYLLKDEQPVEAITTYERVGEFYSQQGLPVKAIAVYKQIGEIIHKHVPHLEDRFGHIVPRLAEIYAERGLTSDAMSAYDQVATRLQKAGRERDAIDIFKKIVDLDPQNPLPHLRLGEAYVRVKNFDNAIERFGAAADILLKLGRRDDALKVVERLLQHKPEARFARMAAEIYLERSGPQDGMAALTKLQICFKDDPKDLETLALLSRAFEKLGQPAKSIEVQKEAARIAKEAGKNDAFNALVDHLLVRAPNDEGVKQLAAMRAPIAVSVPPVSAGKFGQPSRQSIDVEVEEEVILDADDLTDAEVVDNEEPFPMRPSFSSLDAATRAQRVLAQVDLYRRAREYDHATALLVETIDALPTARELRECLYDVLIEAGHQPEGIRQMLAYARFLVTQDDTEAAARVLDEVLLLEPDQTEALAMLRELGYAIEGQPYDEPAYDAPSQMLPQGAPPAFAGAAAQPGYDPNAPLPSYDLEEISAVEAMSHSPEARHDAAPPSYASRAPAARPSQPPYDESPFATATLDDPFAAEPPLPSFPIDEEATQFMQLPSAMLIEAAMAASAPPPASGGGVQLDEESLEEVEFFASHGMFEEAKNLLEEQLARMPNHPLLLERMRELQMMAQGAAAGESGTRAVPRGQSQPSTDDRSFDIAASLDALDALDSGTSQHEPQGLGDEQHQISVETVFEQFKAGVAAQISESDAGTHYDLGVAYKEMNLHADAINEFRLAARDPLRACICESMIGYIYREMGDIEAAVNAFIRGLHASHKTLDQEHLLLYEIGDLYEAWRAPDHAYHHFQLLARSQPDYSDPRGTVAERMRRVEPVHAKPPARAVGAELMSDEFDAALDDLLNGSFPGGGKGGKG